MKMSTFFADAGFAGALSQELSLKFRHFCINYEGAENRPLVSLSAASV